ncbi:MAG: hypothetical protein Q4D65_04190 [Peptostreptococcaceae bacterium]|nr:hypothetical protein [Peptostreptococcaceae bacterium]
MKYTFCIDNQSELERYQSFLFQHEHRIQSYIEHLIAEYQVKELPEYIVLSNFENATKVLSEIKIPAYTNEVRMVITPDLSVWKGIYLKQLADYPDDEKTDFVKAHYQNMGEHSILQIIGHELAHHSELFLDDFEDEKIEAGIWFEEGMVEYISRRYFFTEEEYEKEKTANQFLVDLFEKNNRADTIEKFGKTTYNESYAAIFYEYWRSFLLVDELVEKFGSCHRVFESYHQWHRDGRKIPLSKWFERKLEEGL